MRDGETPGVSRNVPEKLVMILEETQLTIRFIDKGIGVNTGAKQDILLAHVDSDTIGKVFEMVRFRAAVTKDLEDPEINPVGIPIGIFIGSWKIPIDPMPDIPAGADNLDRLVNPHAAVLKYLDPAFEIEDSLFLKRPGDTPQKNQKQQTHDTNCKNPLQKTSHAFRSFSQTVISWEYFPRNI
jgi:hypothetical protein